MTLTRLLLTAALVAATGACAVGYPDGQAYSLSQRHSYAGFTRLEASAGVDVVLAQGPFDVLAETTGEANFDTLIVEVKGDTLRISRKPSMMDWDGPQYRVTVTAPAYSELDASSGSSMEGTNLTFNDLSLDVSSGASVELSGTCTTLDLDISSGASFEGEGLRCATAMIDASSGASADAFASQLADGEASSGASVTFHGQPQQMREDSSSGGSVQSR